MKYKHFYQAIIFRIISIIVFSFLASWFWFQRDRAGLSILMGLIVVIFGINTVKYFNNINRWIAFFLLGIENEDTTLKIPKKTGSKAIDDVFEGMDRLNELFKQTKLEISTQEQYFRMVINQSATGLFSVNDKGRIININPAAEKLTKLRHYHHINSLSGIDKALPEFIMQSRLKESQRSVIFENMFGQKLLFNLSEIVMVKEKIRLVAVGDITKELDTREVDAWVKLARTLSHEIMNNIAPITTLSQVLTGYFSKDKVPVKVEHVEQSMINNAVKGLEVIEERSVGLMNFVENYRKFTKLPEPKIHETNLTDLIENNILASSAYDACHRITINKHIPPKLLIDTDEKLLSQVVTNLFKNACEALSDESIIEPLLSVSLKKQSENVFIDLTNNGPEISPEIREQIFVPFFTTKEGGSGIGLSLSKQIMLKMGGDVILLASKDNETTMRVKLPVYKN